MSVRLNVVVVQSSRMTSLQVGIVAEIVIQLLGRPGVDLAMVTSLDPDLDEATDRLMLTGLENDIAVIDWRSPEESVESLARLGVTVSRAPHSLDPNIPIASPGMRKLYGVDLRSGFRAGEVVDCIVRLLASRQVMTVSLGVVKDSSSATATNGKPASERPRSNALPIASIRTPIPASTPEPPIAAASDSARSQPRGVSVKASEEEDAALDALVDRLNDLDV